MIDTHIHLDQYKDIERHIHIWMEAGIRKIVAVSTNLDSSYKTLNWKSKFPDFIIAAIGFHPEQELPCRQDLMEWEQLLHTEQHLISAIGEVGLPYYSLKERVHSLEHYIEFLTNMILLAKKKDLPVVLHAVHEHAEIVYHLLINNEIKKAHFHWLKASKELVKKITHQGYYVSVTPEVVYRERDQQLVTHIQTERLLLETDGPWPFNGPFANRTTSPLFLNEVVPIVAKLKNEPIYEFVEMTMKNVNRLYNVSC
ncbi:TatD family hydrolase [Litchfieldia salsa]|uniref:TatD DNase family protein n=1 Tax=Litchfieldia salsa TaxID=930152 RepID=A0A1H0ST66_9BACI|nr:TatD family hydrolase [Litchfieldia salsa]SDP44977.1 TatD DNase family protein [Litchfieldia salsa]